MPAHGSTAAGIFLRGARVRSPGGGCWSTPPSVPCLSV